MTPVRILPPLFALLAGASLTACSEGKSASELAALDRGRAASADPAVTEALEDPLMTDRDLSIQDNSRSVRMVTGPVQAIYPPFSAANKRALAGLASQPPECDGGFKHGDAWARRLAPAFRPYPRATLTEAAGNDKPGCRSRVAVYDAPAAPDAIVGWYRSLAARAGYGTQVQPRGSARVLAGTRTSDGAAFYLIVSPRGAKSEVSLLTRGGV